MTLSRKSKESALFIIYINMFLNDNQTLHVRVTKNPVVIEFELVTVLPVVRYSITYKLAEACYNKYIANFYLQSILIFLSKKTENALS